MAWAFVPASVLYAAVFAARLPSTVASGYANADVASGPVIARLLGAAPAGREVLLGNYAWYEALGLQRLLGASRVALELAPYGLALAAFALLGWSTAVATGSRWAGVVAATLAAATTPEAWRILGAWTVHGLTFVHMAALGAWVVWLVRRPRGAGATVGAVVVGASSGIALASDPLLAVAGVAPLALAGVAVGRRLPSGAARAIAVTVATAVAGTVVTASVMRADDIRAAGALAVGPAGPADVAANAGRIVTALGNLAGPGLVALVAGAAVAALAPRRRGDRAPVLVAHAVFWSGGAAALVAAVGLTTAARDVTASRYLLGVGLAAAALVAVRAAGDPQGRALVGAAMALSALLGTLVLAQGGLATDRFDAPTAGEARELVRLARSERATVAYAGYWSAMPLTWKAGLALPVYPVRPCDARGRLCPFEFHRISTWYAPRRGARSLLVVDRRVQALSVTALDPRLGPPLAVHRVGGLEVATFGYDIAARFGPPARGARSGA